MTRRRWKTAAEYVSYKNQVLTEAAAVGTSVRQHLGSGELLQPPESSRDRGAHRRPDCNNPGAITPRSQDILPSRPVPRRKVRSSPRHYLDEKPYLTHVEEAAKAAGKSVKAFLGSRYVTYCRLRTITEVAELDEQKLAELMRTYKRIDALAKACRQVLDCEF